MTLRQKLCDPFGGLRTETADQLEQIAEDFAIGFTKWCASDEAQSLIKDLMLVGEINKDFELKDLMKIYKKDKSL